MWSVRPAPFLHRLNVIFAWAGNASSMACPVGDGAGLSRRRALGVLAVALASASRWLEASVDFDLRRSRCLLEVDLSINARQVPGLSAVAGDVLTTTVRGALSPERIDLHLPLPGWLPNYRITGSACGGWLELRIHRGALSNRVVRAPLDSNGSSPSLGVYVADRRWSPKRQTFRGSATVAGPTPVLLLEPLCRRPRFDRYLLELRVAPPDLTGVMTGVRLAGPEDPTAGASRPGNREGMREEPLENHARIHFPSSASSGDGRGALAIGNSEVISGQASRSETAVIIARWAGALSPLP
jgi:hypothetical protein